MNQNKTTIVLWMKGVFIMKKVLSIVLSIIMLFSATSVFAAQTPETGDISSAMTVHKGHVTYVLKDKVLTISGKGAIENYYNLEEENGNISPFYQNSGIWEVIIEEGVTAIGDATFAECLNIRKVTLPSTLKSIGSFAFYNCQMLREINIPESVKEIGYRTFYNCQSLKKISLPLKLERIFTACFYNTGIKSIAISEGVTEIRAYAFEDCGNLEKVVIPNTVEVIGEYCFYNTDLCDVYYFGTKSEFKKIKVGAHNYPFKNAKIHYLRKISDVKPKIKKTSAKKDSIKLSWNKEKSVTGYEIQYSTDSKFK